MKIRFLGTGAGEGYPSPWCKCSNCQYAREKGGKNIRNHSGIMIDDDILMDMSGSSNHMATQLGISLDTIKYLLVTHAHSDHLRVEELWKRYKSEKYLDLTMEEMENKISAPTVTDIEHLNIYGNIHVKEKIEEDLTVSLEECNASFNQLEGNDLIELDDLSILAIDSNHSREKFTLNYIIKRGGKTLLYALDTGGYSDEVWEVIFKEKFDAIIIENTHGLADIGGDSHMSIPRAKSYFKKLRERGSVDDKTRLLLSHMSPHWTPPHDIIAPELEKEGIEVAYDGLVVEL